MRGPTFNIMAVVLAAAFALAVAGCDGATDTNTGDQVTETDPVPDETNVDTETGELLVEVMKDNVPVAGAMVTLLNVARNDSPTMTDASGVVSFTELNPNTYQLDIEYPDGTTCSKTAEVKAGDVTEVPVEPETTTLEPDDPDNWKFVGEYARLAFDEDGNQTDDDWHYSYIVPEVYQLIGTNTIQILDWPFGFEGLGNPMVDCTVDGTTVNCPDWSWETHFELKNGQTTDTELTELTFDVHMDGEFEATIMYKLK